MKRQQALSTLCLALLGLNIVAANWTVNLELQTVAHDADTTIPHDQFHYYDVSVGTGDSQKKVKTVFDTNSLFNYLFTDTCNPCQSATVRKYQCGAGCNRTGNLSTPQEQTALNGRLTWTDKLKSYGDNSISLAGQSFNEARIFFPTKVNQPKTDQKLIDDLQAGFGLAPRTHTYDETADATNNNFLDTTEAQVRQVSQKTFSFYQHSTIPQIIFGEPNKYFSKQDFTKFVNKGSAHNLWQLNLKSVEIYSTAVTGLANKKLAFDLATRYIWMDAHNFYEQLSQELDTVYQRKNDIFTISQCRSVESKFPDINFTIDANPIRKFTLKKENYVRFDGDDCYILIRDIKNKPAHGNPTLYYSLDANTIILGGAFFDAYYVNFDQTNQFIEIAPKFNVTPQNKLIDDSTRYTFLAIGLLLLLGALAILLNIFKPVKRPDTVAFPPPQQPQIPVTTVYQQPVQYIVTSQVRPHSPQTSIIRNPMPAYKL